METTAAGHITVAKPQSKCTFSSIHKPACVYVVREHAQMTSTDRVALTAMWEKFHGVKQTSKRQSVNSAAYKEPFQGDDMHL